MKKCSATLATKEMQIKTTLSLKKGVEGREVMGIKGR
jgi:hypothetical protein